MKYPIVLASTICVVLLNVPFARAQAGAGVPVHVVITDAALQGDSAPPRLDISGVKVKQGKNYAKVTQVIPATGDAAALQLMILIDDTLNSSIGNHLQELKEFVKSQPASTAVAVGYMANAGVNVAQNFTQDHNAAANAIRLPRGSFSTMDSPYLSLISLVKGWPKQNVRREVLMVTDGIDRLRGETPQPARLGPSYGTVYHSMPTMSVDAQSASEVSQRYNVIVYSIYGVGVGRAGRSSWDLQLGLSGLEKIAQESGGECFSLSTSQLVSFKPYLQRLSNQLANQYYVAFNAAAGKKAGFQRIRLETEIPNSELLAPDNVWVEPPGTAKK